MFISSAGVFDGKSWEGLCQQVFKLKYASDGYQQITASPGDFGLEGFTLHSGYAFQCYCPDKNYPSKELYEAQRDKITADLGKLKRYQKEIMERIGGTVFGHWVFVTPELDRNLLLAHARTKEEEVRSWNLPFIDTAFSVILHDADFYKKEINEIRNLAGEALNFDANAPILSCLDGPKELYETNIRRKCQCRLEQKAVSGGKHDLVERLHQQSLKTFLEGDGLFRRIEEGAPVLYFKLVRLINEYENHVVEIGLTWTGRAEELTSEIRDGLMERIAKELAPQFDETMASQVARHMVARWMAICQLDYE